MHSCTAWAGAVEPNVQIACCNGDIRLNQPPPGSCIRHINIDAVASITSDLHASNVWSRIGNLYPGLNGIGSIREVDSLVDTLLVCTAAVEIGALVASVWGFRRVGTGSGVYSIGHCLTIRVPLCPGAAL